MSPPYYILNGKEVEEAKTFMDWAKWMDGADRHVGCTTENGVTVSTVFLGIDHNWGARSLGPVIFETMVFGGPLNEEQERYSTWDDAKAGHDRWLQRVRDEQKKEGGK